MPEEVREQPLQDELMLYLQTLGLPVLGRITNRGDPGVLTTLPTGRVVALYVTTPSHVFFDPATHT